MKLVHLQICTRVGVLGRVSSGYTGAFIHRTQQHVRGPVRLFTVKTGLQIKSLLRLSRRAAQHVICTHGSQHGVCTVKNVELAKMK